MTIIYCAQITCVMWYRTHTQSRHSLLCALNILWSIDDIKHTTNAVRLTTRLHSSEKNSKRQCVTVQYRCFQNCFMIHGHFNLQMEIWEYWWSKYVYIKKEAGSYRQSLRRGCARVLSGLKLSADLSFISKMNWRINTFVTRCKGFPFLPMVVNCHCQLDTT